MHALSALKTDKSVVMMNFETELMYGTYLLKEARSRGLVYTCADGDQPTVIKRLIDDISFWGFELVMLGNIKGFHDLYTNPTKIAPEADKRKLDHKMCSAYTDGSKLCVEMATLANAMGARVLKPGMLGPRMTSIHDVFNHFDFESIWKSGDPPIVDYVLGAKPTGGVFVIGYTPSEFQQFTLSWFPPDMGPGPYYLFYRPFHLGHIEALNCVAEAVLDGTSRMAPERGMRANVFCYAKKDLEAGESIDGMGGYATYGLIENLNGMNGHTGLPQLISDGVRLKTAVAKDQRITIADCDVDLKAPEFSLYAAACSCD
jgi:predicted homoserine dehydrogenase-like protein